MSVVITGLTNDIETTCQVQVTSPVVGPLTSASTSVTPSANTSGSNNPPNVPVITSSKDVTLNTNEIYVLQWNQVAGMEYKITYDGDKPLSSPTVGAYGFTVDIKNYFVAGSTHELELKACKVGTTNCSAKNIVHLTITSAGGNTQGGNPTGSTTQGGTSTA